MDCPICGNSCFLLMVGQDEFGVIREWACANPECMWNECDGYPEKEDEIYRAIQNDKSNS